MLVGGWQPNLFVTDVVGPGGARLLHGDEAENLKQMVLHNVADDAKLVEVTTAALGAKRFLEGDQHAGNVLLVPERAEDEVAEPAQAIDKRHRFDTLVCVWVNR